ncbi:MAG: ABC-type transport auxiliary lipoprotein family protein [Desulfonatronovibrionaceae bacterium]
MKTCPALGLCILTVISLLSCAPVKPGLERNYFLLEISRTLSSESGTGHGLLAVREFSVSPGYQGKEIVRRSVKGTAGADFYNHYFMLPGPMITQLTRDWLVKSGLFQAVLPAGSLQQADYVLEGAVTAIYGQNQAGSPPVAVVQINFLLLKNKDFASEFLFQKQYKTEVQTQGDKPEHLIQGFNVCLEKIFTKLEADLSPILSAG